MPPRPGQCRLIVGPDASLPGCDYSDEEREFLVAIESYKRRNRRPFPTWREVLHVAHCLGYRKVAAPSNPIVRDGRQGSKVKSCVSEPNPPTPFPTREGGEDSRVLS
jgi:hypothetical protein